MLLGAHAAGHLVGALGVPGGTIGTRPCGWCAPMAERHDSVRARLDGLMDYPFNQTSKTLVGSQHPQRVQDDGAADR